jgi:hypothetical protein
MGVEKLGRVQSAQLSRDLVAVAGYVEPQPRATAMMRVSAL